MKSIFKKAFAIAGLDIRWIKNVRAYEQREWEVKWAESYRFFRDAKIRTVLDIGANTGQFAKMIMQACPQLQILHSFEPLADCQPMLSQVLSGDARHFIHHIGLGDKNGSSLFQHAEFSPCSSILKPKALLVQDRPGAGRIREEKIQLRTLDDWAAENEIADKILIKIDVQGYENHVIAGGRNTIRRAGYVVVEVPFLQLYENQPLFHEIYMMLHNLGFAYKGSLGQNIRKSDGCVLEADALFENIALGSRK
jgi:FkbM family methyltransferase